MTTFIVSTKQKRQVIDITDKVSEIVKGYYEGILTAVVLHTTCAITTADLDPGTENDYLKALEKISPNLKYNHPHDPSHFNDHFLSSLIGTSISIPVNNGKLSIGTWQRIVLLEFNGPRKRTIVLSFAKE